MCKKERKSFNWKRFVEIIRVIILIIIIAFTLRFTLVNLIPDTNIEIMANSNLGIIEQENGETTLVPITLLDMVAVVLPCFFIDIVLIVLQVLFIWFLNKLSKTVLDKGIERLEKKMLEKSEKGKK